MVALTVTLVIAFTIAPTLAIGLTSTPAVAIASGLTSAPTVAIADGLTSAPTVAIASGLTSVPTVAIAGGLTSVPTVAIASGLTSVPTGAIASGLTSAPMVAIAGGRTNARMVAIAGADAASVGARSEPFAGGQASAAQQPPPAAPAGAPARPAGGGQRPGMPEPIVLDDHTGFESIFDGASLKNWDGDPTFWRAESGVLIGETTAEKPLKSNTFLIWRGGQPKDFELKLEYRMSATNSGIQYRSVEVPDAGKWVLKGYQADIDFDNRYTGQLYEERGRGFLALRGQSTFIGDGQKPRIIGSLETGDALKALIKSNDWNQVHIIARGNTLVHIVNGHVMSVTIDDDTKARALSGLLGFQIHTGPPMKVEFRNIYLKTL